MELHLPLLASVCFIRDYTLPSTNIVTDALSHSIFHRMKFRPNRVIENPMRKILIQLASMQSVPKQIFNLFPGHDSQKWKFLVDFYRMKSLSKKEEIYPTVRERLLAQVETIYAVCSTYGRRVLCTQRNGLEKLIRYCIRALLFGMSTTVSCTRPRLHMISTFRYVPLRSERRFVVYFQHP